MADTLSFVLIKDHADKDKKYDQLTLHQELNTDADQLAGGYIVTRHWDDDYSQACSYYLAICPTSGCQLDLQHGTIMYKLK